MVNPILILAFTILIKQHIIATGLNTQLPRLRILTLSPIYLESSRGFSNLLSPLKDISKLDEAPDIIALTFITDFGTEHETFKSTGNSLDPTQSIPDFTETLSGYKKMEEKIKGSFRFIIYQLSKERTEEPKSERPNPKFSDTSVQVLNLARSEHNSTVPNSGPIEVFTIQMEINHLFFVSWVIVNLPGNFKPVQKKIQVLKKIQNKTKDGTNYSHLTFLTGNFNENSALFTTPSKSRFQDATVLEPSSEEEITYRKEIKNELSKLLNLKSLSRINLYTDFFQRYDLLDFALNLNSGKPDCFEEASILFGPTCRSLSRDGNMKPSSRFIPTYSSRTLFLEGHSKNSINKFNDFRYESFDISEFLEADKDEENQTKSKIARAFVVLEGELELVKLRRAELIRLRLYESLDKLKLEFKFNNDFIEFLRNEGNENMQVVFVDEFGKEIMTLVYMEDLHKELGFSISAEDNAIGLDFLNRLINLKDGKLKFGFRVCKLEERKRVVLKSLRIESSLENLVKSRQGDVQISRRTEVKILEKENDGIIGKLAIVHEVE